LIDALHLYVGSLYVCKYISIFNNKDNNNNYNNYNENENKLQQQIFLLVDLSLSKTTIKTIKTNNNYSNYYITTKTLFLFNLIVIVSTAIAVTIIKVP